MTTTGAGTAEALQRPPAEVRYADEPAVLRADDSGPRPPGWELGLRAARRFVVGDEDAGISRKFVENPSLVERALVTPATNRGLMLVEEPGTAKSLLSELIAAAVSGTSTLTVQGGAATTEDQIKYGWNYAHRRHHAPPPGHGREPSSGRTTPDAATTAWTDACIRLHTTAELSHRHD